GAGEGDGADVLGAQVAVLVRLPQVLWQELAGAVQRAARSLEWLLGGPLPGGNMGGDQRGALVPAGGGEGEDQRGGAHPPTLPRGQHVRKLHGDADGSRRDHFAGPRNRSPARRRRSSARSVPTTPRRKKSTVRANTAPVT